MNFFKPFWLVVFCLISSFSVVAQVEIKEQDYSLIYVDNKIDIHFEKSFKNPNVKVFDAINGNEIIIDKNIDSLNSFTINGQTTAKILKFQYYDSANNNLLKTKYIAPISSSTGAIKVFFNHPVDTSFMQTQNALNLSNTLDDKLIEYINACVSTLDIAIYSSASPSSTSGIAGAINSAYNRGVQVRIIYDGSATNIMSLLNSAIPVVPSPTTSAYTIMHNKFVIFDANSSNPDLPLVWTGSTNWTVAQIDGPDKNNAIVIQDQSLALAYQIEFNEMWGSTTMTPNSTLSKFGQYKTDNTPHNFIIGGKNVESYFSPSDGVTAKIKASINSANSDINIAVMDITRSDITSTLVNKYNSGLTKINVLVDIQNPSGNQITAIGAGILPNHAVIYSGSGIMHHKFMVVDNFDANSDPQVLLGSHNWSTSAETKNDENTLIVHDANIANQYFQAFAYIYNLAGGLFLPNLSANQISLNQLTIYPTITSDFINIVNPDNKKYSYSIYNCLGQKIQSDFTSSKVDLSNNAKGLYIVNLLFENQIKTFKIILK
jgi:hypothetical protein